MICTIVLYCGPVILAKYITIEPLYIKYTITALIGILAIVLIAKYAPADTEYIPIISKILYISLKQLYKNKYKN